MLTFINSFSASLPAYLQAGILQGEQTLSQLDAANDVITVTFNYASLGQQIAAENNFNTVSVSYAQLKAALVSHAVTPDALLAVASLPAADPSGGAGFALPVAYAQHLGLASAGTAQGLVVTINSDLLWGGGDDVAAAVEHEITEGGWGRISSLGTTFNGAWAPMDLFRFLTDGSRDSSGGAANANFGLDGADTSSLVFDSAFNEDGSRSHRDLADWSLTTLNDAFGPGGPGTSAVLSPVDTVILQALGYTPVSLPTDDYANAPGAAGAGTFSATGQASGTFEYLADRDVFSGLLPGLTWQVQMTGAAGVAPRVEIVDANGNVLAQTIGAPSGSATASFAVPAGVSGGDFVEAVSRMDSGNGTGGYSLTLSITNANLPAAVAASEQAVMRAAATDTHVAALTSQISVGLSTGAMTTAQADSQIVAAAGATSSVAILAYQFFTGGTPTAVGMDYLVSPTGPNPNNLNSAYYQSFSLENRYINFAVNLGSGPGAGAAAFAAAHASETLAQTLTSAYTRIFGTAPTADKVATLLNSQVPDGLGGTYARASYFASYGGDGLTGVGTKAAMVGWLMAEALKSDVGDYALSNDALLHAVAAGTGSFGVNLIGTYDQAGFHYTGG
jgi:hypothetical protein